MRWLHCSEYDSWILEKMLRINFVLYDVIVVVVNKMLNIVLLVPFYYNTRTLYSISSFGKCTRKR